MSDWVLFDYQPGVRAVWIKDEGDEWAIRTDYFIDDELKAENAAARADTEGKRFGDYVRLASIHHNVLQDAGLDKALQEGDDRYVSRWLNDADHRDFRTSKGRA